MLKALLSWKDKLANRTQTISEAFHFSWVCDISINMEDVGLRIYNKSTTGIIQMFWINFEGAVVSFTFRYFHSFNRFRLQKYLVKCTFYLDQLFFYSKINSVP